MKQKQQEKTAISNRKPLQLGCLRPALPRAQYGFHRTCETFFSFEKKILSHRFAILQIEIIKYQAFLQAPTLCMTQVPFAKT